MSSTHQMLQASETVSQHGSGQIRERRLTSHLDLPAAPAFYHLLLLDNLIQGRAVEYTTHSIQDLWDSIVGKHSDLVNISEGAIAFPLEAGPNVSYEYLCSFKEADGFPPPFKLGLISEAGEVIGQQIHETSC